MLVPFKRVEKIAAKVLHFMAVNAVKCLFFVGAQHLVFLIFLRPDVLIELPSLNSPALICLNTSSVS